VDVIKNMILLLSPVLTVRLLIKLGLCFPVYWVDNLFLKSERSSLFQVERVEIRDVRLPQQLQRAMAAEAEAAREAKAKVIAAIGEQGTRSQHFIFFVTYKWAK